MNEIAKGKGAVVVDEKNNISFYNFEKLVFCWPLIVLGYLFKIMDCYHLGNPEVIAWIYAIATVMVITAMGIDLNRNVTVFFIVFGIACGFIIAFLGAKGILVFHHLYTWIKDINPTYSPGMGFIISLILSVFFLVMMFKVHINNHWVFTNNSFEHTIVAVGDDSFARGAKRVRAYYPDALEFLLCLSGDLIICDANMGKELKKIPHVLFLPWKWRKINKILASLQVTPEASQDETNT